MTLSENAFAADAVADSWSPSVTIAPYPAADGFLRGLLFKLPVSLWLRDYSMCTWWWWWWWICVTWWWWCTTVFWKTWTPLWFGYVWDGCCALTAALTLLGLSIVGKPGRSRSSSECYVFIGDWSFSRISKCVCSRPAAVEPLIGDLPDAVLGF